MRLKPELLIKLLIGIPFFLIFVALLGCADESADQAALTGTVGAAIKRSTVTEDKAEISRSLTLAETDAEEPAPLYTVQGEATPSGSSGASSVGSVIDGLILSDVRWSDHESFFRVVFEVGTSSGTELNQVPGASASLSADGKLLTITLNGIRGLSSNPNAISANPGITSTTINSVKRAPSMDDQSLIYEINMSKPTTYTMTGLDSPGRVVVDVNN